MLFSKQKTAYEMATRLEFRRVLFRSHRRLVAARQHPRGLASGAVSHVLAGFGQVDVVAEYGGGELLDRCGPGRAAGQPYPLALDPPGGPRRPTLRQGRENTHERGEGPR